MTGFIRPLVARDPHESHRAATQLELFFDLVSVIAIAAITQTLHHAISNGHGLEVFPNFVFLFVAIWWAWMNFTWFASAYDNGDALFKVLTLVIMSGAMVFAAGVPHIAETLDFSYGLGGWIIMRVGMIALWLRAAAAAPEHRRTALRYAAGIAFAQLLWIALYFLAEPGSAMFFAGGILVFLVEFAVPVFAESVGTTPWHRHHIIERYGLLNIIVLGEVLLAISLLLGSLYEGHFEPSTVVTAVSAIVLVFAVWWIYFIEEEHLPTTNLTRALVWGYGHIVIFASGALIGAGLGAYLDVITHHSKIDALIAARWINFPVAAYLFGLWFIRDRFAGSGWRSHVTLAGAALFVVLGLAGAAPWIAAIAAVAILVMRIRAGAIMKAAHG